MSTMACNFATGFGHATILKKIYRQKAPVCYSAGALLGAPRHGRLEGDVKIVVGNVEFSYHSILSSDLHRFMIDPQPDYFNRIDHKCWIYAKIRNH
jgi:hypothetical protein